MDDKREQLMVVALGGNAISRPGGRQDIPSQFERTAETARCLVDLVEQGHKLIVTHGNGPQVGYVLRRVEIAASEIYTLPLEICVADTQGGMGYMIAQCLSNELNRRGIQIPVSAVVTTVEVDRADPEFNDPTKPIGGFHPSEVAQERAMKDGWIMREVLKGLYRRVVPSPKPQRIIESRSIQCLVQNGHITIACGGGGIPVVRSAGSGFAGVAAVIDKDRASALLAADVHADKFVILTEVDKVCINFEKPDQKRLDVLTLSQAREYLQAGHFPTGSMGPKIDAAIQFIERSKKEHAEVLITRDDHLTESLKGEGGTRVTRDS